LTLLAYKPFLFFFKSSKLYQPGEAVLPAVGGFQKNTPIVAASDQKHLKFLKLIKSCRSITNTFLAPFIAPFDFTYSI
jgi:hypothetical protein